MLNQDAIDSKAKANMNAIPDEELDSLRSIEPQACNEKPYDIARYEKLNHRLADELSRVNNTLLKIANITKPKDFLDSKYSKKFVV